MLQISPQIGTYFRNCILIQKWRNREAPLHFKVEFSLQICGLVTANNEMFNSTLNGIIKYLFKVENHMHYSIPHTKGQ